MRSSNPALRPPFAPLPDASWARALTLLLVFAGAAGSFFFVVSAMGPVPCVAVALVATAIHALAHARTGRAARLVARVLVVLLIAFALAGAIAWGAVLAWAVPAPVHALVWLLALASLATQARAWTGPRVPLVLPLGLFSTACLVGWAREEWRIECDDARRAAAQASVRVIVPSHDDLAACPPGAFLPLGRYPRKVWPSPDGSHLVFTTQRAIHAELRPSGQPERIRGLVCSAEARPDAAAPRCILEDGKAHNLLDDPARDRLLVGIMSGLSGRTGGVVAVTRSAPVRELARVELPQAGSMFLDPEADLLGNFGDEGRVLERVRASDLTRFTRDPEVPANFMGPDTVRFDARTHRGLACSASGPLRTLDGEASLAVAFRADPFEPRPLAPSSRYPSSWLALSWGCDWDPSHTRVFVAVPSLGQLVTLSYDTGEVIDRAFVGLGYRPVLHDPARDRVYLGNFLRGDVIAVEPATGRVRSRWFAGRYVRDLQLTRDGRALYVTSNLGILRVELD